MRPENTPPNFYAKERIKYEKAATLHFFNYEVAHPGRLHSTGSPNRVAEEARLTRTFINCPT